MPRESALTRIAPGTFRVRTASREETVYVAGPRGDRWAFWNGRLFHSSDMRDEQGAERAGSGRRGIHSLSAPMPASVARVLVAPGSRVSKGDTLLVLEAMKMELPIRALSDGTVKTVLTREGELVNAGQTLVELE